MRKIQVFAMAVFATLIASCSNDDEMTQTPEKDTSIKVTANVQSAATRAGYSSDNLPQTFYLTITGNGDTDYTNVSMTKGENNLYAPTDGSKLLWATTNYDGVNISAYTADITQGFAVQTSQSSEANLEASDLLGATKNGTTDNGATIDGNGGINIAFNHLLVKLNIHFSFNKEYEALTMDKISAISLNGVHTQGTYSEGVLTTAAATGDIKPFTAMDATAKTMTAESIFFPTLDGDSNPTLTFTLTESENVTRNYSSTVTLPAAGLQAGYAYSLNVKIGATEVELSSIQTIGLTGWGTPDGDYDQNIQQ